VGPERKGFIAFAKSGPSLSKWQDKKRKVSYALISEEKGTEGKRNRSKTPGEKRMSCREHPFSSLP